MPVPLTREKASVGRVVEAAADLRLQAVAEALLEEGFEFFAYAIGGAVRAAFDPTAHPEARCLDDVPPLCVVDVQMRHADWNRFVVGRLSPWIDPDHGDARIAQLSLLALKQELDYIRYLDLTAALIELRRPNSPKLAAAINRFYWKKHGNNMMLWTGVPMNPNSGTEHMNGSGNAAVEDGWHWWQRFRTATGNHQKISCCLQLSPDLPGESPEDFALLSRRWMGEPLGAVWLDAELFVAGHRLSPAHAAFLQSAFLQGVQALVRSDHNGRQIYDALNQLWLSKPQPDSIARFAAGYEDHLQTPLQPLSDDLESSTYEIFEKDPTKYRVYGDAVAACLKDKVDELADEGAELVVMVLGAGRGPLVAKCREAIKKVDYPHVRLYAIEKNPNAIVTLRYRNETEWDREVILVESDMRDFNPDRKANIVVSELLGSFGDNELSPECLDGALELMAPDCVSIPQAYTSYLAPLHSPRIHVAIRDEMGRSSASISGAGVTNGSRPLEQASALTKAGVSEIFDVPYVIRLHNHFRIDEPKELFSFRHPNWERASNARSGELRFRVPADCELMGFAGFFDAVLYKDILLSIHPDTHSEDMFSWFPILFPLGEPVLLAGGADIFVRMERKTRPDRVWYEWRLVEPQQTRLQNLDGEASGMKISTNK